MNEIDQKHYDFAYGLLQEFEVQLTERLIARKLEEQIIVKIISDGQQVRAKIMR